MSLLCHLTASLTGLWFQLLRRNLSSSACGELCVCLGLFCCLLCVWFFFFNVVFCNFFEVLHAKVVSASKNVFGASCSDHANTLTKELFWDTLVSLRVTYVFEIKRGRELPDHLVASSFSLPLPPHPQFTKIQVTSQLWEELHVLLFVRALRVGCCAWPRAVTAPWSTITPRSNTVVMELKRAFPAVTCLWLQFCQAQELRTVLFGIIYGFFLIIIFLMLPPNCLQPAKRREKLSCITGWSQITNITGTQESTKVSGEGKGWWERGYQLEWKERSGRWQPEGDHGQREIGGRYWGGYLS